MAPPATKRRKLEHSDSEEESDRSFAGFDEVNSTLSDEGAEEENEDASDASMNGLEDLQEEDEESDEGSDEEEVTTAVNGKSSTAIAKTTNAQKPPKRPAATLQDGVYTAETFKSNIFKLQVDELLEQAKLKYGKKEASAENAMRTLKTIIEHIPSREPVSVCMHRTIHVAFDQRIADTRC